MAELNFLFHFRMETEIDRLIVEQGPTEIAARLHRALDGLGAFRAELLAVEQNAYGDAAAFLACADGLGRMKAALEENGIELSKQIIVTETRKILSALGLMPEPT